MLQSEGEDLAPACSQSSGAVAAGGCTRQHSHAQQGGSRFRRRRGASGGLSGGGAGLPAGTAKQCSRHRGRPVAAASAERSCRNSSACIARRRAGSPRRQRPAGGQSRAKGRCRIVGSVAASRSGERSANIRRWTRAELTPANSSTSACRSPRGPADYCSCFCRHRRHAGASPAVGFAGCLVIFNACLCRRHLQPKAAASQQRRSRWRCCPGLSLAPSPTGLVPPWPPQRWETYCCSHRPTAAQS